MEGFSQQFESKEGLPAFEFTFCNNGKELECFLAPTLEVALDEFRLRQGRSFSSVEGDSFTKIATADVLFL